MKIVDVLENFFRKTEKRSKLFLNISNFLSQENHLAVHHFH